MEKTMPTLLSACIILFNLTFIVSTNCYFQKHEGSMQDKNNWNVFHNPEFWKTFVEEVRSRRSWKCNFPPGILTENLDEDAKLYTDSTKFLERRLKSTSWHKHDNLWLTTLLGACKEISDNEFGEHSKELAKYGMYEALQDFMEHINCFYLVAFTMESKGEAVRPLGQHSSPIHDIDKVDPVMIVGYSERFEDDKVTSLWNVCVDRHIRMNPHHQGHCIWHANCSDEVSETLKMRGLREMVCDKVSRRLQKNLNGTMSDDMWNVDIGFFNGLPQKWLETAEDMMNRLKQSK